MKRRSGEAGAGFVTMLQRYAQTLIALAAAGAVVYGGLTHFATAADVEKKFNVIQIDLKVVALEARKARIEDELFRLRSDSPRQGTQAQILRYEAELRDVSARLRDLEKLRK